MPRLGKDTLKLLSYRYPRSFVNQFLTSRVAPLSTLVNHGIQPDSSSNGRLLPQHAVISTFDLFSIGVGPSSSHTVGPMRAGCIFVNDLSSHGLLDKVKTLKVTL